MQNDEGPCPTAGARLGRWLFRHRSYTLLPLGALVAAAMMVGARHDSIWGVNRSALLAAGVTILLLGEGLRMIVAGWALPGTSGRGTTLRATSLVTSGAYRWTRNPLYLANWLLWAGAALLTGNLAVLVLVLVVVGLQYHWIILAEEHFLRARFGRRYHEYRRSVPRFFPWPPRRIEEPSARGLPASFDWRKAVLREHDTVYLIFLGIWAALFAGSELPAAGVGYGILAVATGVWLATKWFKKTRRRMTCKGDPRTGHKVTEDAWGSRAASQTVLPHPH